MSIAIAASIRNAVVLSLVVATGCAGAQRTVAAPTDGRPASPPRLIVFITVDQLRGDMLDRHASDLTAGFGRLMRGGAWFTNGFQDHANTETAPGHASTMSGRFPSSTGIPSNSLGVPDSRSPLILSGRGEPGASPHRFIGTTLTDWLTARNPATRAFSVSGKDRGAILPIGKSKQQVYWWSTIGAFTTSTYYRDSLPDWVVAFNDRRMAHSYAGAAWNLLLPASAYQEPDSVPIERAGRDFVFPHWFPEDTANAVSYLRTTPTLDSITALFALEGLERLALGRGPQTDVMAVSFSATDYIGHAYGPDSREVHDNLVRLDRTIGRFIDSLYRMRDSSTVMIALTGDHGIQPIPELARARGEATGMQGMRVSLREVMAEVRAWVRGAGGDTTAVFYDGQDVFAVDRPRLLAARISPDSVLARFTSLALQMPGVMRVDRLAALHRANHDRDPIARRWAHQYAADTPIDLVVTLTPYSYWGGAVATHGSPHDLDASVPIIFYGPWIKPGRYTAFSRTVDMGVTLADIARVRPLERVDGVVLRAAIR